MIFKQLFDNKSSTYTYIISSGEGREALIIDPVIENTDEYIKVLNNLKLKLVKVIDTHIHADHITGLNELSKRTKCTKIMGEHSKSEVIDIKIKDGEKILADVIVLATGYKPQEYLVAKLFGQEVADRVGPIWGYGDGLELRNMYRPTGQPGLWLIAGSFAQCRINSKYLALQIKAVEAALI